eukprot:TRINITY_DN4516_c1_g1_i1.p1 TRINITY_DN4516_c1_g1~~TRINITY_DN4516_c1_g1_i1.p1  ORF type:complete len:422 (-),score=95.80 TRINITY_DN4516_c1_g1_i1:769-2034(-)
MLSSLGRSLRHIASNSNVNSFARAYTEAIPWRVGKGEAKEIFKGWCKHSARFMPKVVAHKCYFVPFWAFSFDLSTIDIVGGEITKKRISDQIGDSQFYAGHLFRREMIQIARTDLKEITGFKASLLQPVNGSIDPFAVFESTAWRQVQAGALSREKEEITKDHKQSIIHRMLFRLKKDHFRFQFNDIRSRKIYFPVHVLQYQHFGINFSAYINGFNGDIAGISHYSWTDYIESLDEIAKEMESDKGRVDGRQFILQSLWRGIQAGLYHKPKAFVTRAYSYIRWRQLIKQEKEMQSEMDDDEWMFRSVVDEPTSPSGKSNTSRTHPSMWQEVDPADYYALLGFKSRRVTTQQIKDAFRAMALRYHPDFYTDFGPEAKSIANDRMAHLIKAYSVLRNTKKREKYDLQWEVKFAPRYSKTKSWN